MFKRLLTLEWKAFFRSASFGKSLGLKILMGFLALYFISIFLLAGIGLYPIIDQYMPGEEPLLVVNRYVLLWLLAELSLRFFLQSLPVLQIKPLLTLPVKKRRVVNFVLFKSVFSFFNLLPLLIIIPFGIFNLYKSSFSEISIFAWMFAMTGLTLSVNYANFIIKKRFTDDLKGLLPLVIVVIILAILDYSNLFEISLLAAQAMDRVLYYPLLSIIPALLFASLYFWNRTRLENKFYLDADLQEKQKSADPNEFLWTKKFGAIAPYVQQDLKMIWRNKRPKTAVYMSFLLLGYGLMFYPNDSYYDNPAFFIFVGVFMTGIFMINFGQFIPSWDAGYYPLIMSQNIPLKEYLTAKAALISLSVIALTILATPYLYFGWKIFMLNIVCAIYNIGVNIPMLLYAGSFNRKRIDLDKSPFMNYQGMGAAQWLVGLPLLIFPVFIFWIFNRFFSFEAAIAVILGLGMLGIILRNQIIEFIAVLYKRNKYAMVEGFKQQGE